MSPVALALRYGPADLRLPVSVGQHGKFTTLKSALNFLFPVHRPQQGSSPSKPMISHRIHWSSNSTRVQRTLGSALGQFSLSHIANTWPPPCGALMREIPGACGQGTSLQQLCCSGFMSLGAGDMDYAALCCPLTGSHRWAARSWNTVHGPHCAQDEQLCVLQARTEPRGLAGYSWRLHCAPGQEEQTKHLVKDGPLLL